jgi:uncharacterized SAM-binding protein YcdF (DUF218 family)
MFLFKKITSQFCMPVTLSLSIAFLGLFFLWFTKKQRAGKLLVTLGLALLLIMGHRFVANALLKSLENDYPPHEIQLAASRPSVLPTQSIKYVVVLGGGHESDPQLPLTSQLSADAVRRLVEGIQIYRRLPDAKLIVSGGIVFDPIAHAQLMEQLAIDLGVNPEDIVAETRPKDTKDEARFIAPIVGRQPFFLVTDASHMHRAQALFRKHKTTPIAAPTGCSIRRNPSISPDYFFPTSDNLKKTEKAIHEFLGFWWARLRGQI